MLRDQVIQKTSIYQRFDLLKSSSEVEVGVISWEVSEQMMSNCGADPGKQMVHIFVGTVSTVISTVSMEMSTVSMMTMEI